MPVIRMLEKGEEPLKMHIEPPGPGLMGVFVSGALLLMCGACFAVALVFYLK